MQIFIDFSGEVETQVMGIPVGSLLKMVDFYETLRLSNI